VSAGGEAVELRAGDSEPTGRRDHGAAPVPPKSSAGRSASPPAATPDELASLLMIRLMHDISVTIGPRKVEPAERASEPIVSSDKRQMRQEQEWRLCERSSRTGSTYRPCSRARHTALPLRREKDAVPVIADIPTIPRSGGALEAIGTRKMRRIGDYSEGIFRFIYGTPLELGRPARIIVTCNVNAL
jgi:hypothetical protein